MNYDSQHTDLVRIYGSQYIDKKMPGHYPISDTQIKSSIEKKPSFFVESIKFYLLDKICIDHVIRELTYASIAFGTFLFMQISGRLTSLSGFGIFIGFFLLFATTYNLFKASFKSLTPGILCLFAGLVLLTSNQDLAYFKWLTHEHLNYLVGMGAFFIAISLLKSENN